MNSDRIFAATKDKIYLYNLSGMKILSKLDVDTHLGRIAISPNSEFNPYMLYSQSLKEGSLIVYDTRMCKAVHIIHCH